MFSVAGRWCAQVLSYTVSSALGPPALEIEASRTRDPSGKQLASRMLHCELDSQISEHGLGLRVSDHDDTGMTCIELFATCPDQEHDCLVRRGCSEAACPSRAQALCHARPRHPTRLALPNYAQCTLTFCQHPDLRLHLADLEWRLTYIGNAESEEYDQVLDSVMVGPVVPGQYRFVFQVTNHDGPPSWFKNHDSGTGCWMGERFRPVVPSWNRFAFQISSRWIMLQFCSAVVRLKAAVPPLL